MVIANSESNTTLVSLSDNEKHGLSDQCIVVGNSGLLEYVDSCRVTATTACHADSGVSTELLIPAPGSSGSSLVEEYVPLYLPTSHEQEQFPLDVDEYLTRNYYAYDYGDCDDDSDNHKNETKRDLRTGATALMESRKRLLSIKRRRIGAEEQKRVLYVAQGERANATSKEYDILMSDKATTCHILAFRSRTTINDKISTSNHAEKDFCLTSLTHLDGRNYEECVRDMIEEHIDHHHHRGNRDEDNSDETVTIDIHVMGGFNDDEGFSSGITDWLMRLLADMAKEFKNENVGVRMLVKTLVVTSANNEIDNRNNNNPIGRGLGIDLQTGQVFLAQCQDDNERSSGPVPLLRSARMWSRGYNNQPHKLSVVHSVKDVHDLFSALNVEVDDSVRSEFSFFWIQPFLLRSVPNVDFWLNLPNERLLQYTSTSPDAEEPGYCKEYRASLQFLKHQCDIKCQDGSNLFGKTFDRPLIFAMYHGNFTVGSNKSNPPKASQRAKWNKLSL